MEQEFKADDEAVFRRYLLGQLTEGELDRIEQRLFSNEEDWEHVALVEDDLIDAYMRQELRGRDREQFETHFLASPRRRDRVAAARAFLTAVPVPSAVKPGAPERSPKRLWNWGWSWSAIPVAAGLIVVAGLMLRFDAQLRHQSRESAALQRQVEELRARGSAQAQGEVPKNLPVVEPAPRSVVTPLFSFVLIPGVRRAAGVPEQRLVIPAGSQSVQLGLTLTGAAAYPSYRAVMQNFEGGEVWGASQLVASKGRGGAVLNLNVPATVLRPGDYRLLASGVNAAGEAEELDDYYAFHVMGK